MWLTRSRLRLMIRREVAAAWRDQPAALFKVLDGGQVARRTVEFGPTDPADLMRALSTVHSRRNRLGKIR